METKRKTYPCDPSTLEELSRAIRRIGNGFSQDKYPLNAILFPISPEWIPWSAIGNLFILGPFNPSCNVALENEGLKPGAYINHSGDALLLIRPTEQWAQKHIDRCLRLRILWTHYTRFSSLDLSGAGSLEELSLIHNPGLTRLPGLENLTHLTSLNISWCKDLTGLPGLENLTQLTSLKLSGCKCLTGLPGLENLSQLTMLDLFACTSLTQLPSLENLSQLTTLDLSGCTGLTTLPDGLRKLKKLRWLHLRFLNLSTLPDWLPEIAEGFTATAIFTDEGRNKANVSLNDTTVADIPDMSIFDQPYEVVAEFFRNRSLGKTRALNEIKVVFLGDGEAGKSHTIARLMNDGGEPKDYQDQATPGIVIKRKNYTHSDRTFQVNYWDFGGQEIMHSMHRIFLTSRTMYVVLLNARDDTQADRAHYWLHNIQSFAPGAPVLLVLNKIDQNPNASVDERTLKTRYPGLTQIVKLSALNASREEFNRIFTDVLLAEIQKTGYLDADWPGSWIKVKQELENMKTHYIMGDAYQDICRECRVDKNQKELLHWFNDLGVSFCYDDEEDYALEDYVILRPDWITNALYILLFNHLENARNGQIPHQTIYQLLKNAYKTPGINCTLPKARYNAGEIGYVLGVMRKFQLSLDTGDQHEFIPMLCQQNSTVDFHDYEKDTNTLEFRMDFEYLPDNLLHRLMVERHAELDMDNVWRKGAKFQLEELGLSAVVVIDGNALRFFIQSENPMHRSNIYLAILKANVDRIVKKMGLKEPKNWLIYKVGTDRAIFNYERILKLHAKGRKEDYCEALDRDFLIEDILTQSAPQLQKDERKLLDAIRQACRHLQDERVYRLVRNADGSGYENGHDMEDLRNRRVRDDLQTGGYIVSDQTQRGGGELDILVCGENNEPWTIIEALRVGNSTKRTWNQHLDKLLGRYNTHGLPRLYLLTYVDADPQTFMNIWEGYQKHIPDRNSGDFTCDKDSFTLLTDEKDPHYIRAAKCRYTCDTAQTTVYHIFARIPTENE